MSVWEHSRTRIFSKSQHPLAHDLADMAFSNPRIPGIFNAGDAINYLIACMYPDYKQTVPTPADLPAAPGNSPNDYIIVSDDGSGHAAGYIWSVIDGVAQWVKRYDMAWSMDGVLAEAVNRTMPMYVSRDGFDQLDSSGNVIAGLYAGQKIYGGLSAGSNLTFNANAADNSGYVQTDNHFRPTSNALIDLGTAALAWNHVYATTLTLGTLSAQAGAISDSSGAISFGATNLSTSGSVAANTAAITVSASIGNLSLSNGSLTSGSGALSLGATNLSTTGTVTGASGSVFGNLTLSTGAISSGSGAISFGAANLSTTGTLSAGNTSVTQLNAGNLQLTGNTISATNANGNINVVPNGTGVWALTGSQTISGSSVISGNLTAANATITGTLSGGNLQLSGNTLSSTNANGAITLAPNGTGKITANAAILPASDNTLDLGASGQTWKKVWVTGAIGNTTDIQINDLLSLRNVRYRDTARTQAAQTGDALFYDSASGTWLASVPDSEITHNTLTGLTSGDAGHTQFAMLAGRSGGQAIQGGTAAAESLTLESTSHASKGSVFTRDAFKPATDAVFTTSWTGLDLGDATHNFRDVYTKGVFHGFRFENFTSSTLPTASASSTGRAVFSTDNKKIYVDTGGTWQVAGVGKYLNDIVMDGATTTYTVTVSASIQDATTAIWQLCDNANSYERIFCSIKAISATQIQVTNNPALPAGNYRLIGLE